MRIRAALCAVFCFAAEPVLLGEDLEELLARGRTALAEKRPADAVAPYRAAAAEVPDNTGILFALAEALARSGSAADGLAVLEKAAAFRIQPDLAKLDEAFSGPDGAPRYRKLRVKLEEAGRPFVKSTRAFVLQDAEILPESVAWDAKAKVWYVGSMYQRKIVKVDEQGRASDLVSEGRDGLWGVIGIKLDPKARELWVTSYNGNSPPMRKPESGTEKHGALHRFNVDTGALVARYDPPRQPLGFNDLVLAPNGDVYLTCETSVCVLRKGATKAEEFLEAGGFLNGIAISDDGARLFVVDHRRGIRWVDVATKRSGLVKLPPNESLAGVDGLYVRGRMLVAIQNSAGPVERVVRGDLDASLSKVTRVRVLEQRHPDHDAPTTGVLVGDELHYVGASNLDSLRANQGRVEAGKLKKSAILRLKL